MAFFQPQPTQPKPTPKTTHYILYILLVLLPLTAYYYYYALCNDVPPANACSVKLAGCYFNNGSQANVLIGTGKNPLGLAVQLTSPSLDTENITDCNGYTSYGLSWTINEFPTGFDLTSKDLWVLNLWTGLIYKAKKCTTSDGGSGLYVHHRVVAQYCIPDY